MFEDCDEEQKAIGFGFILAGPIFFAVMLLITKGSPPVDLAVILGLVCLSLSVLGILVLRFPIVYVILRLILPED